MVWWWFRFGLATVSRALDVSQYDHPNAHALVQVSTKQCHRLPTTCTLIYYLHFLSCMLVYFSLVFVFHFSVLPCLSCGRVGVGVSCVAVCVCLCDLCVAWSHVIRRVSSCHELHRCLFWLDFLDPVCSCHVVHIDFSVSRIPVEFAVFAIVGSKS